MVGKFDFDKYKEEIQKRLSYEVIEFEYDVRYETPLPLFQYQHFKNDAEIEKYLDDLVKAPKANSENRTDVDYNLGLEMLYRPNNR